jgi:hypothetical protein
MIQKINFQAAAGTTTTTIFNSGGLQLQAACSSASPPVLTLTATTTVNNAEFQSLGSADGTIGRDAWATSSPVALHVTTPGSQERTLVYTSPIGTTVDVSYVSSDNTPFGGSSSVKCLVNGFATTQ